MAPRKQAPRYLATIGYELATPGSLADALTAAGVEVLADVRAIANSRRPGFSKTALSARLAEAGIEYVHLRGLGTPAEGRAAARAGKHREMKEIFELHLQTPGAIADMDHLRALVESGRRTCIMCLEADATHCHRSEVVRALGEVLPLEVEHLIV